MDVALVISRDKIGEGKEMEIVDQGITSSSHCGPIIQEITACALLGKYHQGWVMMIMIIIIRYYCC